MGGDTLARLGELYRDAEGHEVWRIRTPDGTLYADGVASDHDAQYLAERAASQHHAQALRADRAEDALRVREQQFARLLSMADAWEAEWGDGMIRADIAANSIRRTLRGVGRAL